MPTSPVSKEYNTFVKGLITEASELTFPENASLDEANCVLNRDGSRQRRLGMDYEASSSQIATEATSILTKIAVSTHEWKGADNNPQNHFALVQIGSNLHIHDLTASGALSANSLTTIALNDHLISTDTDWATRSIQVAQGAGVCVVVHRDLTPFYIEYDEDAGTFSETEIDIEVRDLFGVVDDYAVDERRATITNDHRYNLYNQGWREVRNVNSTGAPASLVDHYRAAGSNQEYPSNSDIWHISKGGPSNLFDPIINEGHSFGTTPAPKGAYIIDAFLRGTSRYFKVLLEDSLIAYNYSDVDTDQELRRPETCAWFAGRIFYSGIQSKINGGTSESPRYTQFIFFSQIIEKLGQLAKCYQEADPTSEEISDLVATDGGTIKIPEMEKCYKMIPLGNTLVVVASNGVWGITGGDIGFTATDLEVYKISNFGSINAESVVDAEGSVYFWANGGIYRLIADEQTGRIVPQNITELSIQTFYNDITGTAKRFAKGIYDRQARQVRWMYNNDSSFDGTSNIAKADKELVFDTTLEAFYPNTISSLASLSPYVCGYIKTPELINVADTEDVTVGGVTVTVSGVDVTITETVVGRGSSAIKFLTVVPVTATTNNYTFSEYRANEFMDWYTNDSTGVDYTSFVVSGHELLGDSQRNKSIRYVTTNFKRTETAWVDDGSGDPELNNQSSCKLQARWGWADSDDAGLWSTDKEVYRFNRPIISGGIGTDLDYGYGVITTKNSVPGRGRAVAFKFTSAQGKDFHLLGWGVTYKGQQRV